MSHAAPGVTPEPMQAGESRPAWPLSQRQIGELVFAGLVLALGVFALVGVFTIRIPPSVRVGPTLFPLLVAVTLLGSSAAVVFGVLRGKVGPAEESEDVDSSRKTDWGTLAKIVALVVAHIVLIPLVGWALAAAVLFGGVAWSLGAKRWWVALLIGLALAAAVQFVFGQLLGLSLPLGPLFESMGVRF